MMRPIENWIWLPEKLYAERQNIPHTVFGDYDRSAYTVARFTRAYSFEKEICEVQLRFSGDTVYRLYAKTEGADVLIGVGPASAGGDFLFNELPRPNFYADHTVLSAETTPALSDSLQKGVLSFAAEVQMGSTRMFEFSRGHGGFMLTAEVKFADGTKTVVLTDNSWSAQLLDGYVAPRRFVSAEEETPVVPAEVIANRWFCEDAPIPMCENEEIIPVGGRQILEIAPGSTLKAEISLDKIYACYLSASASVPDGVVKVKITASETGEEGSSEELTLRDGAEYRGFTLHSAGTLLVTAENTGTCAAALEIVPIASFYPTPVRAKTITSDPDLDLVTEVCAHTLKQCRQTLHLDSPRHCEPMACTGDYYIESLMTAFTFGDMRLAAFDVRRTAELLRYHDGRMFHTTYSLIWVQMLWDVYRLTGEVALLADCEQALLILLARFASYIGENGLPEKAPDYMFIDWLVPDGINLHHPPKALGQSCLAMYYYGALDVAAKIFTVLGEDALAKAQSDAAAALRGAILDQLYDPQRQLFFEGLNTPTPEEMIHHYMPQNVEKRYYRRHANILAACFGVVTGEDARALLQRIADDDSLGTVQPYFMHFWLEAIYRCGLQTTLTMPLLELWKAPSKDCPKGLTEGFYKPEPSYSFDHSHAWGGTPAYALPLALSGLKILEPGYRKITLSPALLGLSHAHVEIPAPQGMIVLDLEEGRDPVISVPAGIAWECV